MKKEHSARFVNYLQTQIIVTISELAALLNVSVRTVQRKLKQLEVIKSYDKNGRYFALDEVANFNNAGIWEHNNIHFSKYGNLKNTLIGIIQNSENGMRAVDIRNALGLDTRSFLYHYKDCQEIKREKAGGYYIYFSAIHAQYAFQFANRKKMLMQQPSPVLRDSTGIIVLVETIKRPELSAEGLSKHLRRQSIRIEPKAIIEFYKFHGIEKKNEFRVVQKLRCLINNTFKSLTSGVIFSVPPLVHFHPYTKYCPVCYGSLKVYKTAPRRKILTLHIGSIKVPSESADKIIPLLQEIKSKYVQTELDEGSIKAMCYTLIQWALDGKNHGNGYGFPFDRTHFEFYHRLCKVHDTLENWNIDQMEITPKAQKYIQKLLCAISPLKYDKNGRKSAEIFQEKSIVFDKLRQAMCITLDSSKKD